MTPRTDHPSPNFENRDIPVEFLVLHYTAGDLERALSIFEDPAWKVSCHLLIAEDGEVFELVPCWNGVAKRAAHAGLSRLSLDGREYTGFNDFSLGIELVNRNGNLLEFTSAQYDALVHVMRHLKAQYPSLASPQRVVGHEHVAGWRGKADPGHCFDWDRFFASCYPGEAAPLREPVCPDSLVAALRKFLPLEPTEPQARTDFWHALSATNEAAVALQFREPSR